MRQDEPSCCPAGWQTLWSPTTPAHTGVLKYQTTIQVYTIPIQVYPIPESSSYSPIPPQPLQLTVTHKAVSNNCIIARWYRGETDNRETTPVGYCLSTASFSVRPYCKNARRDRCQEYHNCFPFGELEETTRTSSNYVDEDYPARPEIKQSLPGWGDNCGSESSTLETDVCVWRYAPLVVHATQEEEEEEGA